MGKYADTVCAVDGLSCRVTHVCYLVILTATYCYTVECFVGILVVRIEERPGEASGVDSAPGGRRQRWNDGWKGGYLVIVMVMKCVMIVCVFWYGINFVFACLALCPREFSLNGTLLFFMQPLVHVCLVYICQSAKKISGVDLFGIPRHVVLLSFKHVDPLLYL